MSRARKRSAGLLLYRLRDGRLEVFIAHMGGPFWANKDDGGWSIVKGEFGDDEEPFAAARREFLEETGSDPPDGLALELGEVRQKSGKRIGPAAGVPGDRPRRLVRHRNGAPKAGQGPGAVHRRSRAPYSRVRGPRA